MNFLETTIEQVEEAESVTVSLPGGGTVSVPVRAGSQRLETRPRWVYAPSI